MFINKRIRNDSDLYRPVFEFHSRRVGMHSGVPLQCTDARETGCAGRSELFQGRIRRETLKRNTAIWRSELGVARKPLFETLPGRRSLSPGVFPPHLENAVRRQNP